MSFEPSRFTLFAGALGIGVSLLLWRSGYDECGNGAFGLTILVAVLLLVFRSGSGGPPTRPA